MLEHRKQNLSIILTLKLASLVQILCFGWMCSGSVITLRLFIPAGQTERKDKRK